MARPQPQASKPTATAAALRPHTPAIHTRPQRAEARKVRPVEFLLVALPNRYGVIGDIVAPMLQDYLLQGGVNGVEAKAVTDDNGNVREELDISGARENIATKGGVAIPWDVDGPGTSYLVDHADGSIATRWQRPIGGGRYVSDPAGYSAWLESLMVRGIVPRPTLDDLDRLEANLVKTHDDLAGKPGADRRQVRELDRQIGIVERALVHERERLGDEADAELERVAQGRAEREARDAAAAAAHEERVAATKAELAAKAAAGSST